MISKKHHHLTCEQRYQLSALLSIGCKQKDMTRQLGIDPSTISRERSRNSGTNRKYTPLKANMKSHERRQQASSIPRKLKGALEEKVKDCLLKLWSPDQISGRLKKSVRI